MSNADLQKAEAVDYAHYITEKNCCYEKLYAKYSRKSIATVSEKEYCLAFNMTLYVHNDECKWRYGYKWFNRVSIHWAFMVTKASEDSIIFNNQKLFEIYSDVIKSDSYGKKYVGISNANELRSLWTGYMWKYKVYFLFGIIMGWYNEQLDIIQAKIEHHKINKSHK